MDICDSKQISFKFASSLEISVTIIHDICFSCTREQFFRQCRHPSSFFVLPLHHQIGRNKRKSNECLIPYCWGFRPKRPMISDFSHFPDFVPWVPEWTGDSYLVGSFKILSESYNRMHRPTRFSDRFLQDKHSSYKILTR